MHDGVVLVVDDDPGVRTLLSMQLRKGAIKSESAGSSDEAIERITRGDITLVLVDVGLSHPKEGLELADKIHGLDPELSVMFITGNPYACSEYTYIEVIQKPCPEREFILKVRAEMIKHCTNVRVRRTHDLIKAHVEDMELHRPSLMDILARDVKSPLVRALLTVIGTLLVVVGGIGWATLKGLAK